MEIYTMGDHYSYIQILVNTLQKQIETLKEILELTKEQRRIADHSDFDEAMLEETLNKKEVLIAKLNELDDGFISVYGRVRKEVKEHKELYKDELRQLQSLIKECTDLGVEIKVLEERNRDKFAQCFSGKYREYGSQRVAAEVASRYHQTMRNAQLAGSHIFNKKK